MSYKYLRGKTYKVTFALGAGATVQYNRLVATTYNLEVVYSTREKYRQALRPFLCPKIFLWWVKIKKLSLQFMSSNFSKNVHRELSDIISVLQSHAPLI